MCFEKLLKFKMCFEKLLKFEISLKIRILLKQFQK